MQIVMPSNASDSQGEQQKQKLDGSGNRVALTADNEVERRPRRATIVDFRRGVPALQLSAEDTAILKRCNSESFLYRCVPFMAFLNGILVYRSIRNRRLPSVLQYLSALAAGYLFGKISYIAICEQKIAYSNSMSPFAQQIRLRLGMPLKKAKPKKSSTVHSTGKGEANGDTLGIIVNKSDD